MASLFSGALAGSDDDGDEAHASPLALQLTAPILDGEFTDTAAADGEDARFWIGADRDNGLAFLAPEWPLVGDGARAATDQLALEPVGIDAPAQVDLEALRAPFRVPGTVRIVASAPSFDVDDYDSMDALPDWEYRSVTHALLTLKWFVTALYALGLADAYDRDAGAADSQDKGFAMGVTARLSAEWATRALEAARRVYDGDTDADALVARDAAEAEREIEVLNAGPGDDEAGFVRAKYRFLIWQPTGVAANWAGDSAFLPDGGSFRDADGGLNVAVMRHVVSARFAPGSAAATLLKWTDPAQLSLAPGPEPTLWDGGARGGDMLGRLLVEQRAALLS